MNATSETFCCPLCRVYLLELSVFRCVVRRQEEIRWIWEKKKKFFLRIEMDEKGIEQKIKSAVTSDFHINILVNFTWVPPGPSNLSKPQKRWKSAALHFQIGPSINSALTSYLLALDFWHSSVWNFNFDEWIFFLVWTGILKATQAVKLHQTRTKSSSSNLKFQTGEFQKSSADR